MVEMCSKIVKSYCCVKLSVLFALVGLAIVAVVPGFDSPDAETRGFCITFPVRTKGVYEYGYKIYPTP